MGLEQMKLLRYPSPSNNIHIMISFLTHFLPRTIQVRHHNKDTKNYYTKCFSKGRLPLASGNSSFRDAGQDSESVLVFLASAYGLQVQRPKSQGPTTLPGSACLLSRTGGGEVGEERES